MHEVDSYQVTLAEVYPSFSSKRNHNGRQSRLFVDELPSSENRQPIVATSLILVPLYQVWLVEI